MDSVGEGEGGEIWENGIEICKISCMKRVASPGSMHDTGRLGLVHWDHPEGGYGEGGGRMQHALGQRNQRQERDPDQELDDVAAHAQPQPGARGHVFPACQAVAGGGVAGGSLEGQLAAGVEDDVEYPQTGDQGGDGAACRHAQAAMRRAPSPAAMRSKNAAECSISWRRCLSMVIMW